AGKPYDVSCEVYSLGCVLFHALTGVLPFPGQSVMEVMASRRANSAPTLRAVSGRDFPPALEKLLADCLSSDQTVRPESASEFKQRLTKTGGEVSPLVEPAALTAERSPRRKFIFAGCAAVVLGLGCVGFYKIEQSRRIAGKPVLKSSVATPRNDKSSVPDERRLAEQLYGTEFSVEDKELKVLTDRTNREVTRVRVVNCDIRDPSVLSQLSLFPKLKHVSFERSRGLTVAAMENLCCGLSKIVSLHVSQRSRNLLDHPLFLDLSDTDVTEEGIARLERVPTIFALSLAGTQVTDQVVEGLARQRWLRAVDVSRTALSMRAIEKLAGLNKMILIRASDCPRLGKTFSSRVIEHASIIASGDANVDSEFAIFYRASQLENGFAQCNLASLYYLGKGVDRDFDEALKWYKKGSQSGQTSANASIAMFYRLGLTGPRNPQEALKWYHLGFDKGDFRCAKMIARLYESGELGEPENAEAARWYRKAAERGDADAEWNLGELYLADGFTNYKEALKWHRKSAAKGEARALNSLGVVYQQGLGVKKDFAASRQFYEQAIEKGNANAINNLGCMYLHGEGVPEDSQRAMQCFLAASANGYKDADANIAFMYEKGIGVERDERMALKWYLSAGKHANADALVKVGDFFRDGRGTARDTNSAAEYYRKAVELGSDTAKSRLAR
ncbi:MAG: hypothetical protein K2Z81_07480, partial [Cyanobacteria bacterium]|nr:hypothetical protein [Cyanobacteriota bacterium]